MARPDVTLELTDRPQPTGRFTLRFLFQANAVCGLAFFADVQFGPLVATRDIGIGVAIVLVLEGWFARNRRFWTAAAWVCGLAFIPTIVMAGAPFSDSSSACKECGMVHEVRVVCGCVTVDQLTETDASRWAKPLVRAGHLHAWTPLSSVERWHWFGSSSIACGATGEGAYMAWQLAFHGNHAEAELAYREYQDILTGKSTKSMAVYRQEIWDAISATIAAKRQ